MKISGFIDELSRRLRDVNKRQWDREFLVDAVNNAFICLCNAIPASHVVELDIILKRGARQKLPERLHRIVDLLYNVGPSGETLKPITNVDRGALDTAVPDWRTEPARGSIRHWVPSNLEEDSFDVWPQATGGMGVHGIFTTVPVVTLTPDTTPVVVPTVVVPPKPVLPDVALYEVDGLTTSPSDGQVVLRFIDDNPVSVGPSGWPIPDGTILDVVIPDAFLLGNLSSGATLNFDHVVNSYAEGLTLKDNDDYTRIYHNDPIAETGNYILDTRVAPETRSVGGSAYIVAVFPVLNGTFDGARFDAISDGVAYAWLTGRFRSNMTGGIETTALIEVRAAGFHGFWDGDSSSWVISDGVERVSA